MNSSKKNKRGWIISLTILLIIISAAAYKFDYLSTVFYNIEKNHYAPGDKIFASDEFMSNPPKGKKRYISFFKLAKNQSSPYDIIAEPTCAGIRADTLRKCKTILLGTYIDYKLVIMQTQDKTVSSTFYAIKPNWKITDTTGFSCFSIKPGYALLDNNIYIIGRNSHIK